MIRYTILSLILIAVHSKSIHLGILVPIDGAWNVGYGILPIVHKAIATVHQLQLLQGFNITYITKNSKCSANTAAGTASDLAHTIPPVDAFIGPGCSDACLSAGLLAHYWNKPMISYSCSSSDLEDSKKFSTFARTQPFSRTYSDRTPEILRIIMQYFTWNRAAIIAPYGSQGDDIWHPIATSLRDHFLKHKITVPYYNSGLLPLFDSMSNEVRRKILKSAMKSARVIFLLGTREQVSALLLLAKDLGMLNGSYAFITIDFYVTEYLIDFNKVRYGSKTSNDVLRVFNGLISLTVKKTTMEEGRKMSKWLLDQGRLTDPNFTVSKSAEKTAPYLHDAILLYAHALNKTLNDGKGMDDGRAVFSRMVSSSPLFDGMTGPVMIDERGNRVPTFVFENILINDTKPLMELWPNGSVKYQYMTKIVWPGGSLTVPNDNPKCVFIPCPEDGISDSTRNSIITGVVVFVFLAVSVLIFYCRKRKYENELLSKTWIIDYTEISPVNLDVRFASKVIRYCDSHETSKLSRLSFSHHPNPLSSNFGQYKNEFVALKRLHKDNLSLSREMLIELKQVRDLVHGNLIQYVGVCLNPFHICIVSQYCHRGSLQEILANDDIKLDWFFRASFANDICMGMQAIHNSCIHVHGSLRSSKCLIDNRWVCKIADYGLNLIKANQRPDPDTGQHAAYTKLYWKAPELLDGFQYGKKTLSSQPGDVYSFGIILNELVTREEPYSETDLSPRDIIARICSHSTPPFRPDIPACFTNIPMIELMKICWADNQDDRPTFNEIKRRLRDMNKGKHSIVDNMLRLMENYTDQLENIVEERTRQLAEEKARTDQLLHKMLPRSIADLLKQGQPMIAESFKSVTVYFSDIVGFTSLAAISTPLQVVHFLNDLYVNFDTIIDSFNVYKVETIGDAYMVVSGLPVPNGNKHVEEIATMSLQLLKSTMNFKIRHLESRPLQIRIGMHTGPCVAGVVGLKMPRYCLFGDTVNYASRMESTGVPNRIHVSSECKNALDIIGGWELERRGEIEIKGKGNVVTYFLNGKCGMDQKD